MCLDHLYFGLKFSKVILTSADQNVVFTFQAFHHDCDEESFKQLTLLHLCHELRVDNHIIGSTTKSSYVTKVGSLYQMLKQITTACSNSLKLEFLNNNYKTNYNNLYKSFSLAPMFAFVW